MNATIEILDEVTHQEIQVDFAAARSASRKERILPVVISEFHSLMFHYPIVFVKDKETGEFTCSVLLGINTDANLLDEKDIVEDESLPLNIRRLPLLAVESPEGETRPLIAIDMASPGVGRGDYIFNRKSNNFESAIFALGELYEGYKETRAYVKKVLELDLISKLQAQIRYADKPPQILEGLYSIDANKIAHLVGQNEMNKDMFLYISRFVYAQHFSLSNMQKIARQIA